jgi:MoaA/NifB/PqqE/SkfB family radical SAM enzyme
MCSRNYWVDEIEGHMADDLFEKAMSEAADIDSIETISFGGIGEPLFHPHIVDMICLAKKTGKKVELITNGTLLDAALSMQLVETELDRLWISIDSIDEDQYENIRQGASYSSVMQNIKSFNKARVLKRSKVKLGLSFVFMKSNMNQLPKLPAFARQNHISDIKISNLIPNTESMVEETIFEKSVSSFHRASENHHIVKIDLPYFDISSEIKEPLFGLVRGIADFSLLGTPLNRKAGYCRFVNEGNIFIRWDGEVCPCMALLHSGKTYLYHTERSLKYKSFGSLCNQTLAEIWHSEAYTSFRKRVVAFDFSPCTICGACDKLDNNQEDCYNNPFPVCGGCLWAQGIIQCP